MTIPRTFMAFPVLLERPSGGGSGFLFDNGQAVFLVTAKHVLFSGNSLYDLAATATAYGNDLKTKYTIQLDLSTLESNKSLRSHASADVAVIKIGELKDGTVTNDEKMGVIVHVDPTDSKAGFRGSNMRDARKFDDAHISNDIFLFGYPRSLGLSGGPVQFDPTKPLIRKGIIAGKNDVTKTIIIDSPVYFGNSGGLVIEVDANKRFFILGLAVQFIPFVEELRSLQFGTTNTSIENSGYAVVESIERVIELT